MTEVFKIFLGADKNEADTPELRVLGDIAANQGFHLFINTSILKSSCPEILAGVEEVIIRGGYAECCVASAIDFLLNKKIKVSVDLPNIRCSSNYWDPNINSRLTRIVTNMEENYHSVIFIKQ